MKAVHCRLESYILVSPCPAGIASFPHSQLFSADYVSQFSSPWCFEGRKCLWSPLLSTLLFEVDHWCSQIPWTFGSRSHPVSSFMSLPTKLLAGDQDWGTYCIPILHH